MSALLPVVTAKYEHCNWIWHKAGGIMQYTLCIFLILNRSVCRLMPCSCWSLCPSMLASPPLLTRTFFSWPFPFALSCWLFQPFFALSPFSFLPSSSFVCSVHHLFCYFLLSHYLWPFLPQTDIGLNFVPSSSSCFLLYPHYPRFSSTQIHELNNEISQFIITLSSQNFFPCAVFTNVPAHTPPCLTTIMNVLTFSIL